MCGIGGIININNSKIDPEIANNIKTSLEHRGPDNSSIKHISDNVSLVHTRLAIIGHRGKIQSTISFRRQSLLDSFQWRNL